MIKFKFIKDFKEFALKGNMIDIAIGVIIGAAFNKVVDVIVKEIFLPPLSLLTDGITWGSKRWILREAMITNGDVVTEEIAIGYGKLLETGMDFLIIGFTVFLVVRLMNSLRQKSEDPKNKEEVTPKNIELLNQMVEKMEVQITLLKQMAKSGTKN
ncbi:large-conductance mechanosensitive channel protein MscL [Gangjinia marincola]|uniref:Large-conductance mechanosensitive channel n=1 Tax=Gangjinia marincola TaxID=578463 RepID=A0ABN1MFJ5_9FLAO